MNVASGEIVTEKPPHIYPNLNRIIGSYGNSDGGPLIIAIGGMHGNEPSGVEGLRMLFHDLETSQTPLKGKIVGLTGNLEALKRGERFLDQDLNRMWKYSQQDLLLDPCENCQEKPEFEEINHTLEKILRGAKGPVIFIDLHTTSAPSPPFLLIGDTLRNREFVKDLPVPVILGLEENLNGPLLSYINEIGHISMGFEAGQHDSPDSALNQFHMLWMILEKAGCISSENIPGFRKMQHNLAAQTKGLKHFYEVRYRHGIDPSDQFKMLPGFRNFQSIHKGDHLANDRTGKILSRQSGKIFMPLYQKQGDDGFFVVRRVPKFWLGVSRFFRLTGFPAILPLLPGVKRHPEIPNALVMNTRTVRFFGVQIFHLMGYRKRRRDGHSILMVKRSHDKKAPAPDPNFVFPVKNSGTDS